jgi:peptidyl-prolyl cis-trans isomerase A (cyclophilin A)
MKKIIICAALCLLTCVSGVSIPVYAAENAAAGTNPVVVISTNMGDITVELHQAKAPVSVKNFLGYAESGFYTDTVFHRVIPGFMIQGGGFTEEMVQKSTRPAIKNEAQNGLSNKRGTLAMARTSVVDSATSQFFINVSDNTFLDHGVRDFGYAVFGTVITGMDIVDAIAKTKTGRKAGHPNVPVQPVIITGIQKK